VASADEARLLLNGKKLPGSFIPNEMLCGLKVGQSKLDELVRDQRLKVYTMGSEPFEIRSLDLSLELQEVINGRPATPDTYLQSPYQNVLFRRKEVEAFKKRNPTIDGLLKELTPDQKDKALVIKYAEEKWIEHPTWSTPTMAAHIVKRQKKSMGILPDLSRDDYTKGTIANWIRLYCPTYKSKPRGL
jgi:hypothetical protein